MANFPSHAEEMSHSAGVVNMSGANGGAAFAGVARNMVTQPDTGYANGRAMEDFSMAMRQQYATPTSFERAEYDGYGADNDPRYNVSEQNPKKYVIPTHQADRQDIRNIMRKEAPAPDRGKGVQIMDTIGDDEIDYVQNVRAQARTADMDRYAHSLFNCRKPGDTAQMMKVRPDVIKRDQEQVAAGYSYAIRTHLIDMFGINTEEDFNFKYLVDNGEISGPSLVYVESATDQYTAGVFSPAHWRVEPRSEKNNLKLPFSKSKYGHRPSAEQPNGWMLKKTGALGKGNDTTEIVQGMFGNLAMREGPERKYAPGDRSKGTGKL